MNIFFAFSGQGAQAVGMGKELYETSNAAKAIFDQADEILGYKLSEICFNGPAEKLTETNYCQVAIYTMSCAALEAFREKFPEVKAVACAGLSLGEYGALYAANAFSFADGLRLLSKRASLMDECCKATNGGMASVLGGDLEVIRKVCGECGVDVANYNSPTQTVISGEKEKVAQAVDALKASGIKRVIVLNVAGAFHSSLMQKAGDEMKNVLVDAKIDMPATPVYHNYTASVASSVAEVKENLAAQVASSVRWEESVKNIISKFEVDTMIEFGPGAVLTGLQKRTNPELKLININSNIDSIEL